MFCICLLLKKTWLTGPQSDRTPAEQQLAQYLKVMRSLREKISRGGENLGLARTLTMPAEDHPITTE